METSDWNKPRVIYLKDKIDKSTARGVEFASFDQDPPDFKQTDDCLNKIVQHVFQKGEVAVYPPSNTLLPEKQHTTLKQWTERHAKSGLVYHGLDLTPFAKSKAPTRSKHVITNILLIIQNLPPSVLTVTDEEKDQASYEYNLFTVRQLIQTILSFTSHHVSAVYGLVTLDDLSTEELFHKRLEAIVKDKSESSISRSLDMPRRKTKDIVYAFLASLSATNVIEEGSTWFLTEEQFRIIIEHFDTPNVTIVAQSGTGGSVLLMEMAYRLDRLSPTLGLIWADKYIHTLRKRRLCSSIVTLPELQEKIGDGQAVEEVNIVTNRPCNELAGLHNRGVFWCIKDQLSESEQMFRELKGKNLRRILHTTNGIGWSGSLAWLMHVIDPKCVGPVKIRARIDLQQTMLAVKDKTYEEIRSGVQGTVTTSAAEDTKMKLQQGDTLVTLIGDYATGKSTVGYTILNDLAQGGHNVFIIDAPEEYWLVKDYVQDYTIMMVNAFGALQFDKTALPRWKGVLNNALNECKNTMHLLFLGNRNVIDEAVKADDTVREITDPRRVVDLTNKEFHTEKEKRKQLKEWLLNSGTEMDEETQQHVCAQFTGDGFFHYCRMFTEIKGVNKSCDAKRFFATPMEYLNDIMDVVLTRKRMVAVLKEVVSRAGKLKEIHVNSKKRSIVCFLAQFILKREKDIVMFSTPAVSRRVIVALCAQDGTFFNGNLFNPVVLQHMKCGVGRSADHIYLPPERVEDFCKGVVKQLHKKYFRLMQYDIFKDKTLCEDVFDAFFESKQMGVDTVGETGDTLLHVMSNSQNEAGMRILLNFKADVNIRSENHGKSALHFVCQNENVNEDVLDILLKAGSDINMKDSRGKTPLHLVMSRKDPNIEIITKLITSGANPDIKDSFGRTSLHNCFKKARTVTQLQDIMKACPRVDVNIPSGTGRTLLHYACRRVDVNSNIIETLLAHGADVNKTDITKRTPLHTLCASHHTFSEVMEKDNGINTAVFRLLSNVENIDAKDEHGRTALHMLCARSDVSEIAVDVVSSHSPDLCLTDASGMTPLHYLCMGDSSRAIQAVVDKMKDVNITINSGERRGQSPLHLACITANANPEVVRFLLDHKANILLTDAEGRTPLHYLCQAAKTFHFDRQNASITSTFDVINRQILAKRLEIGFLLLEKARHRRNRRSVVIDENTSGYSSEEATLKQEKQHVVTLNRDYAIMTDADGRTALHMMCMQLEQDIPMDLFDILVKCTDVGKVDYYGMTSLHYLSLQGSWKLIDKIATPSIINKPVEQNTTGKRKAVALLGQTALHLACLSARPDVKVVSVLRGKGANIRYADSTGKTALDYMKDRQKLIVFQPSSLDFKAVSDLDDKTAQSERQKIHHLLEDAYVEAQE